MLPKSRRLTSPIRFSRHSTTELLVAAEQTASILPWNTMEKALMLGTEPGRPKGFIRTSFNGKLHSRVRTAVVR